MTREEALEILNILLEYHGFKMDEWSDEAIEAMRMGVFALQKEPCEDCISRKAVDELSKELVHTTRDKADFLCNFWEGLQKLPPVKTQELRWIPVSERLPENAKHKGAFCNRYYVMTEFGQTEGWYNPDVGCWYVLLWFMDARFETWNISLERGDVPKLVKNVPVIAWMSLPKPYEPQESEV